MHEPTFSHHHQINSRSPDLLLFFVFSRAHLKNIYTYMYIYFSKAWIAKRLNLKRSRGCPDVSNLLKTRTRPQLRAIHSRSRCQPPYRRPAHHHQHHHLMTSPTLLDKLICIIIDNGQVDRQIFLVGQLKGWWLVRGWVEIESGPSVNLMMTWRELRIARRNIRLAIKRDQWPRKVGNFGRDSGAASHLIGAVKKNLLFSALSLSVEMWPISSALNDDRRR